MTEIFNLDSLTSVGATAHVENEKKVPLPIERHRRRLLKPNSRRWRELSSDKKNTGHLFFATTL